MLFKLFIPFTLAAVTCVDATPVSNLPDVINRDESPVDEYNATAAALKAAAMAPKLETRGLLEARSDCHGSLMCDYFVRPDDCIAASNLRYGDDNTDTDIYPDEIIPLNCWGVGVEWLTPFSDSSLYRDLWTTSIIATTHRVSITIARLFTAALEYIKPVSEGIF